jgi:hypothetical protein
MSGGIQHWEEFQGSPTRVERNRVRVTLNRKGIILMNKVAFEVLGEPRAVKLLFSKATQAIGLKAGDPTKENSFPVKRKDRWFNRTVAASPFCRHYGIRVDRTVLFYEADLDFDGVLQLELAKTVVVGRGAAVAAK